MSNLSLQEAYRRTSENPNGIACGQAPRVKGGKISVFEVNGALALGGTQKCGSMSCPSCAFSREGRERQRLRLLFKSYRERFSSGSVLFFTLTAPSEFIDTASPSTASQDETLKTQFSVLERARSKLFTGNKWTRLKNQTQPLGRVVRTEARVHLFRGKWGLTRVNIHFHGVLLFPQRLTLKQETELTSFLRSRWVHLLSNTPHPAKPSRQTFSWIPSAEVGTQLARYLAKETIEAPNTPGVGGSVSRWTALTTAVGGVDESTGEVYRPDMRAVDWWRAWEKVGKHRRWWTVSPGLWVRFGVPEALTVELDAYRTRSPRTPLGIVGAGEARQLAKLPPNEALREARTLAV